jgi:hypothetical protein
MLKSDFVKYESFRRQKIQKLVNDISLEEIVIANEMNAFYQKMLKVI